MTPISTTRPLIVNAYTKGLSARIFGGEITTRDYREFCAERGVDEPGGVFIPGCPHAFPLRKPMICRNCGWIAETERIDDDDDASIQMLPARGGDPQHAEPAEYAQVCVQCGAKDSFEAAPLCADCDEYPCVCDESP